MSIQDKHKLDLEEAQGIIRAQRSDLKSAWAALDSLSRVSANNPAFAHTAVWLAEARELVHTSLDAMSDEVIEQSLRENFCSHCGRKKDPDKRYCHENCAECANTPVPEGMPCAAICVKDLGPRV